MVLLPNTAGCFTAEDAVRTCRLARELELGGENPLVKLEVLSDPKTLLPDAEETLKAAKQLVAEGFQVLPYTNDDPVAARKLEDAGLRGGDAARRAHRQRPGLRNPYALQMILEQSKVPVIVDAGVGTASDCAVCMELGVSGLLVNTAISGAQDPVAHGARDEARDRSGPARVPLRPHSAQALRHRLEPALRGDRRRLIRLYLITPAEGDPLPALEAALAVLPRGVAGVQLRQPGLTARDLLARCRALRALCSRSGAALLVNDRADVALAGGADGVHLPARGLSVADARNLGLALVGVSAHSPAEVARAAREGADFAVFAPVYDTPGKRGRGQDALLQACRAAAMPVLALGGIRCRQRAALPGRGRGRSGVHPLRARG